MDRRPASTGTTLLLLVGSVAASVSLTGWIAAGSGDELRGRLVCVETTVRAPTSGRVAVRRHRPGDTLRTGDTLLLVENDESRRRAAELTDEIARLDAEIERLRARVEVETAWRLREIDGEIHETELRAAELLRQRFDEEVGAIAWADLANATSASFDDGNQPVVKPITVMARPQRERPVRPSYAEGTVHVEALLRTEKSRNAIEVFDAQIELCEQRVTSLRSLRERVGAEIAMAHGTAKLVADRDRARDELERVGGGDGSQAVVAPGFGELDEVLVAEGDVVVAGQPVATVVDRARSFVELPIPSAVLDEFPVGTSVHVLFPGGARRRGRVESVTSRAHVDDATAAATGDSYVLARIVPEGKLWPDVPLGTAIEIDGPVAD